MIGSISTVLASVSTVLAFSTDKKSLLFASSSLLVLVMFHDICSLCSNDIFVVPAMMKVSPEEGET